MSRSLMSTITLILMVALIPNISFAEGVSDSGKDFWGERYRGWLWFEHKERVDPLKKKEHKAKTQENAKNTDAVSTSVATSDITADGTNSDITPEMAKAAIEQFAKELEDLRFMMLVRPTPETVKAYRDKEKQMWTHAEKLHEAWDMANLLYPEQRDLINNPVNVHAVKAKREFDLEENAKKIKELAKKFDLVLFFSSACKYCKLLSPVLKHFATTYGFNIEAVSSDNSPHEYFKTASGTMALQLIDRLGITAFPTVIAVSHDSKTAFELIRGYVSISELEEYSLLAIKYLQAQGIWNNHKVTKNETVGNVRAGTYAVIEK